MLKLALAMMVMVVLPVAQAAPLKTEIPTPPPMPADNRDAQPVQPQIVVIKKQDATITEYRVGGHVYMRKVKPKIGPPYYLIDENGSGSFVRRDRDPMQPPMWTIKRF